MARNQNKRLSPSQLAEDEAAFNALQAITGYAPANTSYSVAALTTAVSDKRAAQAAEDQQEAALATARDNAVSLEWAVHNLILGAKDSVRAQFGKDSTQVREIGLKRASEYKTRRPSVRPAPTA